MYKHRVIVREKYFVKSVRSRNFFWSVFYRIRSEYGEIQSISPNSVRMRENTDQKTPSTDTFHAVKYYVYQILTPRVHKMVEHKLKILQQEFYCLFDRFENTRSDKVQVID